MNTMKRDYRKMPVSDMVKLLDRGYEHNPRKGFTISQRIRKEIRRRGVTKLLLPVNQQALCRAHYWLGYAHGSEKSWDHERWPANHMREMEKL